MFFEKKSSFSHPKALSFPSLSKSCQTKFKPLSDKLEKKACILSICIFLLSLMNCEIIAEVKLGEEHFPHLYNIS